ncbi:MAG: DNA repair protein RecN [Cycloclasticus sp. symbiont of Bathymodiolus heckerae]|nr:MAG: DNA repair protein RecN [Cycloclasticus sp. symbiont of Bathymodiolus heckerae]
MLRSINIKGLAVVEQLNLELEQGMTTLTGETGAGKSILLTAMKLCLGERADANLLRHGADKADISLDFDISQTPDAKSWLSLNELAEDSDCLIRRTINADGRSKAFINGHVVNLKTLQQLSQHLISIHGQHAHLDLLQPEKQYQLLDTSLPSQTAIVDCNERYNDWKKLNHELVSLTGGNDDNDSEKQLLKYQINELEQADILHLNYDELVQEHTTAANMSKIIEIAEKQICALYEDENRAIHSQLSSVSQELEELTHLSDKFSSVSEQIKEAAIQIQEASRDLRHITDQQNDDPEQMAQLDRQLSTMHSLARKLHIEPHLLTEKHNELVSRLELLDNRNERLNAIQQEITNAIDEYEEAAKELHAQRVETAKELSNKITSTLKTLGLPDGYLEIQVGYSVQENPKKNGLDDVSFLVTTNPGMPALPIGKVASGGELSRISLAIQVVTSQNNTIPTLVFDEVDAGIGGGVAETVGMCLRSIALNRQVLCVTHLPQVASQGHQHLFVSKNKSDEQTKTQITTLNKTDRVNEVARMLGGIDISETTLAHAKEMVEKAI